jgi:tetratricopeptide (TPR) repeat protein
MVRSGLLVGVFGLALTSCVTSPTTSMPGGSAVTADQDLPELNTTQSPLINNLTGLAARYPDKVRWNALTQRMEPSLGGMIFQHTRSAYQQMQLQLPDAEIVLRKALREYVEIFGAESPPVAPTLLQLGYGYVGQGKLQQALHVFTRAHEIQSRYIDASSSEMRPYLSGLGLVQMALGNFEEARSHYQEALDLHSSPDQGDEEWRAYTLEQMASLYRVLDRPGDAIQYLAEARQLKDRIHVPGSPELATSLDHEGLLYLQQGQPMEAEQSFRRAITLIGRQLNNPLLAVLYDHVGAALFAQQRYADAKDQFERAVKPLRRSLGDENPITAAVLQNLARAHLFLGQYPEAERVYHQSHRVFTAVLGEEHPRTGASYAELALLRLLQSDLGAAEPLLERALRLAERSFLDSHPAIVDVLTLQAVHRRLQQRPAEAEALLQRAFSAEGQASRPIHLRVAMSLRNLGDLYQAKALHDEAEQMYLKSLSLQEQYLGRTHIQVGGTLVTLAKFYKAQGKLLQAADYTKRAAQVHEDTMGPVHRAVGDDLAFLGLLYLDQGRLIDAEPLFRRSLSIHRQALPQGDEFIMQDLDGLARVLRLQARYGEALHEYEELLRLKENHAGIDKLDVAVVLNNIGDVHRLLGHYREAESLLKKSVGLYDLAGSAHPDQAAALNNLALTHMQQNQDAQADADYKRSIEVSLKAMNKNDPRMTSIFRNYGTFLSQKRRHQEARALLKQAAAAGLVLAPSALEGKPQ